MTLAVGVLGSTKGTSLQGVIDAVDGGQLDARIVMIVSDRKDAYILERAAKHGIPHRFIDPAGLKRPDYDALVTAVFREAGAQVILMAGYMRITSGEFVDEWQGRLINVHPSLLPAFAGGMNKDVHRAVLESGAEETGCTIHIATAEIDAGPVLLQKKCRVMPGDTVEQLKDRVQALEREAFVEVLQNWRQS